MKKILTLILSLSLVVVCLSGCGDDDKVTAAAITQPTVAKTPDSHYIADFETILQEPELPTGCEITSLTMALNYYGYDVDKITMAYDYLPILYDGVYTDNYGITFGPEIGNYFLGDPGSAWGYFCYPEAIVTAANEYLSDEKSMIKAVDISGTNADSLYELVAKDTPVIVWITVYMTERWDMLSWYTESGEEVEWSQDDHCGVLIGYDDDSVTIADPISGEWEYDRDDFEEVYLSRGQLAVILE